MVVNFVYCKLPPPILQEKNSILITKKIEDRPTGRSSAQSLWRILVILIHVIELRSISIYLILQVLLLINSDQQIISILEARLLVHL